jgi:hypothetical protein
MPNTLRIQDLPEVRDLNAVQMSAVKGGSDSGSGYTWKGFNQFIMDHYPNPTGPQQPNDPVSPHPAPNNNVPI